MGCTSCKNSAVEPEPIVQPPAIEREENQEMHILFKTVEGVGLGGRAKANNNHEAVIFEIYSGGALDTWNQRNPAKRIRPGDKIVAVNDTQRDFWPMMFELRSTGTHHIVISRGTLEEFVSIHSAEELKPAKLSRAGVESLPKVPAGELEATECSICLEDLRPTDLVSQLPCGHVFHSECASRWLTECRSVCPLCNTAVVL